MKFKTYAQQSRAENRRKNKRAGKKQHLRGEIANKYNVYQKEYA